MTAPLASSYIIDRQPKKYGGQQADYEQKLQKIVTWGAKKIKETPQDEAALIQLFSILLKKFSEERQTLAYAHLTFKAERFGSRRDVEGTKDFYHTHLDDIYKEYNPKILAVFADHLRKMPLEKKNSEKKHKKLEETCLEYDSSFEIEVLEGEDLARLKWHCPAAFADFPTDFPINLWEKRGAGKDFNASDEKILKQGIQKLKQTQPELYKRVKMSTFFLEMQKEFPSPLKKPDDKGGYQLIGKEGNLRSFFVVGTARLKMNGKMYATTQYLTWLYRDFQQHPVDRMLKYSTMTLIHQDNFLIDDTLKEVAKIFAKALSAKQGDLKQLKESIMVFRYIFAHCMCFERGSAAIGEFFEKAIYEAREWKVIYNKNKQIDLEALTSPLLSQFVKNYDSMITLEPMKS